ncbi:hypothetical protein AVEN_196881-1 [Araneus ventricosus]|uniref:Uncharacterized protein n=1 Tax=Araneus ventricosus TaxID=182803 RepID=A0A4Y2EDR7_ARAVE|nr:hypothetical protein AVEN_196881-1 [Araneus ventricosus]
MSAEFIQFDTFRLLTFCRDTSLLCHFPPFLPNWRDFFLQFPQSGRTACEESISESICCTRDLRTSHGNRIPLLLARKEKDLEERKKKGQNAGPTLPNHFTPEQRTREALLKAKYSKKKGKPEENRRKRNINELPACRVSSLSFFFTVDRKNGKENNKQKFPFSRVENFTPLKLISESG